MDERSDLAVRAEVLNKLADQLSEQLAVERRANDELRALLRDGPTVSVPRERNAGFAPLVTTLAGVAVAVTICVGVASSWNRAATCPMSCPARFADVAAVATPPNPVDLLPLGPPAPPPATVMTPITVLEPIQPIDDGRPCGPITNVTAARCLVSSTGGVATGERGLRMLILAYTLLGDRAQGRPLAERYFREYASSPFTRQIAQLGYAP